MRNYYLFFNNGTGWMQDGTTWLKRSDAIEALFYTISMRGPGTEGLIGYDDDKGMLRIPDSIVDVPEDQVVSR